MMYVINKNIFAKQHTGTKIKINFYYLLIMKIYIKLIT